MAFLSLLFTVFVGLYVVVLIGFALTVILMSYSLSEAAAARRPWWKCVAALVRPARLPKSCATAPAAPPRWPQFRRASPFLRIARIETKVCPKIAISLALSTRRLLSRLPG